MTRAFADLHTHSRASFDSLASPAALVRAAAAPRPDPPRDHRSRPDRWRPRGARPGGRDRARADRDRRRGDPDGRRRPDLPVPRARRSRPGCRPTRRSPRARAQGGLVGMPHPFDRFRGSLLRDAAARAAGRPRSTGSRPTTPGSRSARATSSPPSSPLRTGCPGSRCPTPTARSRSASRTRPSTATRRPPPACSPRCATAELVTGRASLYVRLLTPLAKVVQRARGNGRIEPTGGAAAAIRDRAPERRRAPERAATAGEDAGATTPTAPRPRASSRDERRPGTDGEPARERRASDDVSADSLSLGRRLRQPRTIISLVLPLILLFLIFRVALNVDVNELPDGIRRANPLLHPRRRSSSSTPASRSAATAGRCSCAGTGFRHRGPATPPRSSSSRGS